MHTVPILCDSSQHQPNGSHRRASASVIRPFLAWKMIQIISLVKTSEHKQFQDGKKMSGLNDSRLEWLPKNGKSVGVSQGRPNPWPLCLPILRQMLCCARDLRDMHLVQQLQLQHVLPWHFEDPPKKINT